MFQADSGVTLVGVSELLSWKQSLYMWACLHQVVARNRRASPTEYASRIEGISDAVLEEFAFLEQYGVTGGNVEALYPDDVYSLTGSHAALPSADASQIRRMGILLAASSIEDQIRRCDWSSIL